MSSYRWLVVGKEEFSDVPGGLNRYVSGLVSEMKNEGLDVTSYFNPTPNRVAPRGPASGVNVARRVANLFVSGIREGSAQKPTVVNWHFSLYGLPFVLGFQLSRWLCRVSEPVSFLAHFHGPWAQESLVAYDGWKLRLKVKRFIESLSFRLADNIIVLSEVFRARIIDISPSVATKVQIVRPGIDSSWISSEATWPDLDPMGTVEVACIRRLTRRMGILPLLQLLEEIDFTVDGHRIHVTLIGDGEISPEIDDWIDRNGRSVEVSRVGRIPDESVRRVLSESHLTVVPTTALEGFGLVVLESMAMGRPVISTGEGGLGEALGPWNTPEYIFNLRSSQSLHAALLNALVLGASTVGTEKLVEYASGHSWAVVVTVLRSISENQSC